MAGQAMARRSDDRYPDPGWRDWGLVIASFAFVSLGLVSLRTDASTAAVGIAFFGFCGGYGVSTILRKRRFARIRVGEARIPGGVPLRPSRARTALLGAALAALGAILLVTVHRGPEVSPRSRVGYLMSGA
jgi:hypothetical protein